jgi:hypothetical protein
MHKRSQQFIWMRSAANEARLHLMESHRAPLLNKMICRALGAAASCFLLVPLPLGFAPRVFKSQGVEGPQLFFYFWCSKAGGYYVWAAGQWGSKMMNTSSLINSEVHS